MISTYRIWAVILRNFYASRRDFNRLFDFTYWPFIDIFLFGFICVWLTSKEHSTLLLTLMLGLVLWQVAYRTNLEISRSLVQELWDNNLINIFSTPITIFEWILGLMLTGILCLCITVTVGSLAVKLIYGQNIFVIGWPILVFILLLAMSGWILGLIGASFLLNWGQRVETMVWAMGWLPAPFCSVYYPVDVLPAWAQCVSKTLPMTYAFEAMRSVVIKGYLPKNYLIISFLLNSLYLILATLLFLFMLKKRKNKGLANLR